MNIRWLAALLVIAIVSDLAWCSCTPSDCVGPVTAVFASQDCSGPVLGYSQRKPVWPGCTNTTSSFSRYLSSTIETYTEEYQEYATYRGTDNCGGGSDGATRKGERKYFGTCVRVSGSVVYLADVNQSFVSPQRPEQNPRTVPTYNPISISCSDPASCLAYSGQYTVHYTDETCSQAGVTYTVDPNTAMNTCYKDGPKYVKRRCLGPNTVELVTYYNSDCTRPISSEITGSECSKGDYAHETLVCVGSAPAPGIPPYSPPTSPRSPIPSSGGATKELGFAFGILAIILFISAAMN